MAETKRKQQTGTLQSSAQIATIDEAKRTFEVVFATETPVFRRGWDENYNEILSCKKDAIRTTRLDNGSVPLIDSHGTWSISGMMGRVVGWELKSNQCRATIQFSSQESFNGIWDDIKASVIRNVSVGYRVWKYQRESGGLDETAIYRAIDWEPMEISLVSVPADPTASVRKEDVNGEHEVEIIDVNTNNNRSDNMEQNKPNGEQQPATAAPQQQPAAPVAEPTRAAEPTTEPAKPATTQPAGETRTAEQILADERVRVKAITDAARGMNIPQNVADGLIDRGVSVDAAKAAMLDHLAETSNTTNVRNINVTGGTDEKTIKRNAIVEGLMHRADRTSIDISKPEHARAHDYKFASMLDIAKECVRDAGHDPRHMSKQEIVSRAIATTDFPDLLTSTTQRFLRKYYDAVVPDWKPFGTQVNAPDFRAKTGVKVDANVTFEEISEGGEYKESTVMSNEKAIVQLKTYARKFSITRIAIINDDLSVFTKLPRWIALGAQQFQSKKFWGLVSDNATSSDNIALFQTATHKNLASSGAVISDTTLSAARTAMRRQKSPEGNEMMIVPSFLIIPPELETSAAKILTAITANTTSDVNVWAGKLKPVVVDYLTNTTAWYLAADPNAIMADGLVYSYLEGEEGLYTESFTDRDNDNVVTKARLDFDCRVWGHQGWYKNPGA
jgi:hypothetical protein